MKIKAIFDKNDQFLGWMEVTGQPIDFITDDGEQVYELKVDDGFLDREHSEQIETEIRAARNCV
ncbi:MAG: hypothetical protein HC835_10900 [Oscillatoriales cyanobacterium RM2_1_1]|nr:hypothetical protein [Oscillatoriales cyanobacterium SM2_3_0]NJO46086.1 hypothetical protein [Oscillatoriales cyanobacterium RM2_1_1]